MYSVSPYSVCVCYDNNYFMTNNMCTKNRDKYRHIYYVYMYFDRKYKSTFILLNCKLQQCLHTKKIFSFIIVILHIVELATLRSRGYFSQ